VGTQRLRRKDPCKGQGQRGWVLGKLKRGKKTCGAKKKVKKEALTTVSVKGGSKKEKFAGKCARAEKGRARLERGWGKN